MTVNSPIAGQWSQTGMFGFGSEGNYSTPFDPFGQTFGSSLGSGSPIGRVFLIYTSRASYIQPHKFIIELVL